ncbi:MAG: hypothetical protein IT563_03615 [Alphaproteobacteria bacterium]|nr:hypothetical protein [Alphaproteobacteria bacterium]
MAEPTPESIFLAQRRPLLRLAQAWLRGANDQTLGLVRDYRRFFAELLVSMPEHALLAAMTAPAGDILRSWIEAELPELPPDGRDRPILDAIGARLRANAGDLRAHLAAAGYLHAFALEPAPAIAAAPPRALPMLMRYWLRTPRLFRTPNDARRYHAYLLAMLDATGALADAARGAVETHAILEAALGPLDIQMAFHDDGNLRPLLEKRGRLLERAIDLTGLARRLDRPALQAGGRRLRVGFLVRNMDPRTESFIVLAHAEGLDKRRFETVLYTQRPAEGAFSAAVNQRFGKVVVLDSDPARAVDQLRDETLDIAVLGNIVCFDNRGLGRVAACRVAPVQLALAAIQPSTTGFDSVDAFVSARSTEPDDAQDQYTERLALIDATFNVFSYANAGRAPAPGGTRKAQGLPPRGTLFLGGASMPKLQPALTRTWMRILARIPDAVLALYPFNPNWWPSYPHYALRQRLAAEAAEAGVDPARVRLLASMSMGELIQLAGEADVFLDSFPYSGNASLMEPLAAGCPVVALEGASQRALQGASTLRAIGLDAFVASDIEQYVDLAARLAGNTALRKETSARIRAAMQKAPFFDSRSFGAAFGALLERLHAEAAAPAMPERAIA